MSDPQKTSGGRQQQLPNATLARALTVVALLLLLSRLASADSGNTLSASALVDVLQRGGYTLYFRHAATDWSTSDHVRKPNDWTSCDPDRIRQLSEEGRETARAIGKAMRALRIPVSAVFASPYCRTRETARLLDLESVQLTTDVMNMRVAAYFGGREAVAQRTRARLAILPAKGTNNVFVAHGNVIRAATSQYPGEAECLVFRADGKGGFRFVGRITPAEWQRLAFSKSTRDDTDRK